MARIIMLFILIIHGFIHLLGFVKAFNLVPIPQLTGEITRPVGLLWLLAALLFLAAAFLYGIKVSSWWMPGAVAVIISQGLIILYWSDAKYGTIPNVILAVPIIIAFAGQLQSSYQNVFKQEVEKGLSRSVEQELLTVQDIIHLPDPVQKYIRYSGAVGKPKLQNFRAVFHGQFKPSQDAGFLDIQAVQYNFFDQSTRAFYMESAMYGLPINGLHLYAGSEASMQITVANLLEVVNARGPEMNRSETVTLFNDICFLAPAGLINKNIEWEPIDKLTTRARFTNQSHTISATLYFNKEGQLVNFSSDDRAESVDGETFKNYRWTTPLSRYREIGGRRVAIHGEATWHKPEGEYTYAKFNLVEITYNATDLTSINTLQRTAANRGHNND